MKFEILDRSEMGDEKSLKIDLSEDCLKKVGADLNDATFVEINFNDLALGDKTYGTTKGETIDLQKKNCKQVIKFYRRCVKVIKFIRKKKFKFDGKIYVENLDKKQNNNDFMLKIMLETKFNVPLFRRLKTVYLYTCEYIDLENKTNKMCDFKDNQCVKHRDKGIKKATGCCPSFCKFTRPCACVQKNLSCKIFMCDYLIEKGFYFSPNFMPILRLHFSFIERAALFGLLCRSTKKALGQLWGIRIQTIVYSLILLVGIVLMCL